MPHSPLRHHASLYEINTWVWLDELSRTYRRALTLADIPDKVLDDLAAWYFDAIWLMGVWQRSPLGVAVARSHPDLQNEYRRALPNLSPDQVIGSPYAVFRYAVEPRFGGREGLAIFREKLAARGMRLILDYVPNHVAVDHAWTVEAPNALVRGTEMDLVAQAGYYFRAPFPESGSRIFAHGRDPYFPAWTDTAQIDAFSPEARRLTRETLLDIATQCDGVRCDMVMLLVNRIFAKTWKRSDTPATEFWADVIPAVRQQHPGFVFMAEVYWGMESELQGLGFDYTYDKTLYDRMLHEPTWTIRDHLMAPLSYQQRMVRFIENHDEARAMAAFGPHKSQAAAILSSTTPGIKLYHHGQFEGRRVRLPVQLGSAPDEPEIGALTAFYRDLLAEVNQPIYHEGEFVLLACHSVPGRCGEAERLLAYAWVLGETWRIVVANMGEERAEGRVMLPNPAWSAGQWRFINVLNPASEVMMSGDSLLTGGLPVALEADSAIILSVTKA